MTTQILPVRFTIVSATLSTFGGDPGIELTCDVTDSAGTDISTFDPLFTKVMGASPASIRDNIQSNINRGPTTWGQIWWLGVWIKILKSDKDLSNPSAHVGKRFEIDGFDVDRIVKVLP